MTRNRMPTIIDIAEEAGVSKSAVSRALLGQGDVSPATRKKVEAAAQKLGYVANAVARSLVSARTRTLGVVLRDARKPYYSFLQASMQERAAERGYRLVTTTNSGDLEVEDAIREITNLISLQVDGILIAPARLPTDKFLPFLSRVPIVVAGRRETAPGLDSVASDDWDGGQSLARHLLQLGHRHIAVLLVDQEYSQRYHTRGKAMISAISEAGAYPLVWHTHTDLAADQVVSASRDLADVTALMCPTDGAAMDVLETLRLVSPEGTIRHSVTGYGGYGPLAAPYLGLSTFRDPQEEIGHAAVDLLADKIDGRTTHDRSVTLRGVVVPGRTVFPPTLPAGGSPGDRFDGSGHPSVSL